MSESIAVATSTTPAAAPVQPKERIALADILRGFALLGVLMINTIIFLGHGHPYTGLTNSLDRAAWLFTRFFAQAKFYTIFSFLFGWGMSIQMRRAEERGGRFVPLYARRLLILLLIGLAHALLVWYGDILNNYAALGFILLLFRRRSNRFILVTAAVCILIPVLLSTPGPMETFTDWYDGLIRGLQEATRVGREANVYVTGSYWDNVVHRLALLRSGWAGALYWCTHVIGMFLLGLYAGRRRLLENSAQHLPFFRKLMLGGLIVGLPLNTLWVGVSAGLIDVAPQYRELATRGARTVAGSALALAYISILVLLAQRRAWLSKLAPLGRMALSNYLIQSLVFTLVFYGYGLGFYGRFGPAVGLLLTLVFYSLQVGLSQWWIDRYQFGPMEWVWRSLTYGRPQPMISQERRQAQEVIQRRSGHQ